MIAAVFIISYLVSFSYASTSTTNQIVHESRKDIPRGFVDSGPVLQNASLNFRIALVQGDMVGLEQELYAVSTPDNERYGQHLTREEVESFVKPSNQSITIVNQWLADNGISAMTASPAGDWLAFTIPVNKAGELLHADFRVFTHVKTGLQVIRTMSYSIPADLKGHLDLVHPTITFPNPLGGSPLLTAPVPNLSDKDLTSGSISISCSEAITPACIQALYGVPTTPATQSSNVLGVTALSLFITEYANEADLKTFLKLFRSDLSPNTTFDLQTLDGGSDPQNITDAGAEVNLDIQYTIGIASDVSTILFTVGPEEESNPDDVFGFLDLINLLLSENNPPQVLTTSYGWDEDQFSTNVANQLCNAFMQLGARGTSILFPTGDDGADCDIFNGDSYIPAFPPGCPYMTSVGGTAGVNETAWPSSTGGFSNIFPRPSYQSSAVSSYLSALGETNAGLFNTSGRAYPDVSAQAENVIIVLGRLIRRVGGTSCASPIFASVIALLNDELIAAGKSPLGFLNPFLYSPAGQAALNDIITGSNSGCTNSTDGFPALAGWDPVTGLGTPNYAKLRAAVGL